MKINYCSRELQKGAEWLNSQLNQWLTKYKGEELIIDNTSYENDIYYHSEDFFVLYKLGYPIANEYIQIINERNYSKPWLIFDDVHALFYLIKMSVNITDNLKDILMDIKEEQTVRGYIRSNYFDHTGPMRVLILTEPDSEYTERAIKYFTSKYSNDYEISEYNLREVSIGILAIYEYNALLYSDIIESLITKLIKFVFIDGNGFKEQKTDWLRFSSTCLAFMAVSRYLDFQEELIKEAITWIKKTQEEDGSWHHEITYTSIALLSLIYLGEGPKISIEELEKRELIYKQKLNALSQKIVTTNPYVGNVDIYIKIREMINQSSERLFICSRFITEFHDDILNIKKNKQKIDLRIISIDSPQAQNYKGDGKKFVKPIFDILQRGLEGCFKTTSILHARCIITDNAILISSADLTPEQLRTEFNMGLYTRNPETVEDGARIFKELWDNIQ
jgi:hypothetical protein